MVFVLGAASSALDALKSLTSSSSSSSSSTTGSSQDPSNPFDLSGSASTSASSTSTSSTPVSGSNKVSQLAPITFSALLVTQGQSSTGTTASAVKDLFSLANANGGEISKSQFENAFGAGGTNIANADKVFNQLDANADGSVSFGELSSALKSAGKGHHHAHIGGSDGSGDSSGTDSSTTDPLLQALQGDSGTTVTNSDGSTTTSLTYADGSKVTLTSPAATTASSNATSSYNIVEQLIQREAQGLSSSIPASLSISV
jgi:Ca2+-binding EF-hand superfamily protein